MFEFEFYPPKKIDTLIIDTLTVHERNTMRRGRRTAEM